MLQIYLYVPEVSKVYSKAPSCERRSETKALVSETTSCRAESLFVQATVVPLVIVNVEGLNAKPLMSTSLLMARFSAGAMTLTGGVTEGVVVAGGVSGCAMGEVSSFWMAAVGVAAGVGALGAA